MASLTRQTALTYLERTIDTETQYFEAHEIASELNASPQAVAQYRRQRQGSVEDSTIEQWGRSKRTTRKGMVSGGP